MKTRKKPLYRMIYESIIDEIKSGKYTDGDKLPPEKVISKKYGVSNITTNKALELLAESDYIKRIPGRGSFITQKSPTDKNIIIPENGIEGKMFGLIMESISDSFGIEILKGIEKEATLQKSSFALRFSQGSQLVEEEAIESLIELGVCGLIIMPVHGEKYNPKIMKLVLDQFPVVFLDRHLKGLSAPFAGTDNVTATIKAAEYLFNKGHRKISFISPPPENTSTIEDRMTGFEKLYSEHSISVDKELWITDITCTIPGKNTEMNIKADIEKIKNHLLDHREITSIIAVEYLIALLAQRAIKAIGKKVPEDISIMCFDVPENDLGRDFYTHIKQNEYEIGISCVQLLNELIFKKELNTKKYFQGELIEGISVKNIN